MKQLGNLAIICAQRKDTVLEIREGKVKLHIGNGPGRTILISPWDDDENLSNMAWELNFGKYAESKG